MKTQIIKIIPCLLVGFILSACVGAVNLADGATHPCIATPFSDTCGGAEFNDARKAACIGSNSNQCAPIITRVCEADSLDALCADRETYYSAQHTACRGESDSARCALTITRVCDANPLDALCTGKEAYYSVQKTACESEPNSYRCTATYTRVCDGDVFSPYCVNAESHYPARKTACESEPNSERCAPIIARACTADSLDVLCTGKEAYYPAQKTACENEPNSERCRVTYARVCDGDVFNPYCANAEAHFPARKTACESEPNSERCRATFRQVCDETPFGNVCQLRNLKQHDLPDNNYPISDTNSFRPYCPNQKLPAGVYFGYDYNPCTLQLPNNIDIVPLNNNNKGTSIYTGTLKSSYYGDFSSPSSIVKNIDIIVNFDNNTLSYSGHFRSIPFSINGSFTDRGIITGSANLQRDYDNLNAPLIGLIGQTEMIGGFLYTRAGSNKITGGFTATRK